MKCKNCGEKMFLLKTEGEYPFVTYFYICDCLHSCIINTVEGISYHLEWYDEWGNPLTGAEGDGIMLKKEKDTKVR